MWVIGHQLGRRVVNQSMEVRTRKGRNLTMIGKKAKSPTNQTSSNTQSVVDPLYQLFERSLVNRSYDDSAAFTKQLAEQYLAYLDSTPAHVPFAARASVLEDLSAEAHELLVKKMYGCVREQDYRNSGAVLRMQRETLAPCEITLLNNDQASTNENK